MPAKFLIFAEVMFILGGLGLFLWWGFRELRKSKLGEKKQEKENSDLRWCDDHHTIYLFRLFLLLSQHELSEVENRINSQFECEVFSSNLSITSTLKISTNFTTVKLTETHRKVGFCV